MRGGTAHCHVRLSCETIPSPLINRPLTVLAFNEPSVDKFLPELLPGGLLMINSSMVNSIPERTDVKILAIPATEAAKGIGNPKVANMVMLGAYIETTHAVEAESILSSLTEHGMRPDLLKVNREALDAGRRLVSP
jgi:2-oxoglutarate ferredoxin oxidoreductase subunit gamma